MALRPAPHPLAWNPWDGVRPHAAQDRRNERGHGSTRRTCPRLRSRDFDSHEPTSCWRPRYVRHRRSIKTCQVCLRRLAFASGQHTEETRRTRERPWRLPLKLPCKSLGSVSKTGETFSEQRTLIFKTRQVWEPQAGSVRLRGRSVPRSACKSACFWQLRMIRLGISGGRDLPDSHPLPRFYDRADHRARLDELAEPKLTVSTCRLLESRGPPPRLHVRFEKASNCATQPSPPTWATPPSQPPSTATDTFFPATKRTQPTSSKRSLHRLWCAECLSLTTIEH